MTSGGSIEGTSVAAGIDRAGLVTQRCLLCSGGEAEDDVGCSESHLGADATSRLQHPIRCVSSLKLEGFSLPHGRSPPVSYSLMLNLEVV